MTPKISPLISTDSLAALLLNPPSGAAAPVVMDASWYLPNQKRDGMADYLKAHIPGAVYFDIDAHSDRSSPLPHMLPSPENFARDMSALGIGEGMHAVVYEGSGLFSAARVWWMLRLFGMRNVQLLDGGLPKWKLEGRALESGPVIRPPARFEASFAKDAVASLDDVRNALEHRAIQVVDARAGARFRGEAPEPRPGLPSGHMPGALSLPIGDLVSDGRLLAPHGLRKAFAKAGFDPKLPAITSCGSGVTAAIINLAMEAAGEPAPRLYDGSWTEWASKGMPVAKS